LTKLAAKVAAGGSKAQDLCAGKEVIERFFFYGINRKAGRMFIRERVQFPFNIFSHKTEAVLIVSDSTVAGTEGTKEFSFFLVPPFGLV